MIKSSKFKILKYPSGKATEYSLLLLYKFKDSNIEFALNMNQIQKPQNKETTKILRVVPFDNPPLPVGGFGAIQNKLEYPDKARESHIEGKVIIRCIVDEDG